MNEIIEARRRLLSLHDTVLEELCRRHAVRVLTLFGSAADHDVTDPHDLDIGVLFEPGSSPNHLALLDDLVRLLGTERIDLLDAQHASETARVRAIADGQALYESEPTAYAFAAMAADTLFMETRAMRRSALESLQP